MPAVSSFEPSTTNWPLRAQELLRVERQARKTRINALGKALVPGLQLLQAGL